jgi:hypothetical protein
MRQSPKVYRFQYDGSDKLQRQAYVGVLGREVQAVVPRRLWAGATAT